MLDEKEQRPAGDMRLWAGEYLAGRMTPEEFAGSIFFIGAQTAST